MERSLRSPALWLTPTSSDYKPNDDYSGDNRPQPPPPKKKVRRCLATVTTADDQFSIQEQPTTEEVVAPKNQELLVSNSRVPSLNLNLADHHPVTGMTYQTQLRSLRDYYVATNTNPFFRLKRRMAEATQEEVDAWKPRTSWKKQIVKMDFPSQGYPKRCCAHCETTLL